MPCGLLSVGSLIDPTLKVVGVIVVADEVLPTTGLSRWARPSSLLIGLLLCFLHLLPSIIRDLASGLRLHHEVADGGQHRDDEYDYNDQDGR